MEFLLFVGGVILFIYVLNLRSRVKRLEQEVRGKSLTQAPITNHQQSQTLVQKPSISQSVQLAAQKSEPGAMDQFVEWVKEDWLLKLGAVLLLIGFGWLATYAFLNNWIGPMGRIVLGIVAGVLFILLGWWRIKKYINQGGVFLVLGSTTILLTLFAAREVYEFFTPLSVLIVMFLSTAFVALTSVRYNSRALTLASLILAGIAPLLINLPTPDYVQQFTYLLVVTLGTVWIVAITGRRELTAAALIMIIFYSLPHFLFSTRADEGTLLLFAYAFAAVFFFMSIAGVLRLKGKEALPDLVVAAGNGLLLLAWIMTAAQDEWKSLIIVAWALVFTTGSFLVFKATQRKESFYAYAGVAIAMLVAATSAELEGATLIIAYTIESALIAFGTYMIVRDINIAERVSLLMVGPIILSFSSVSSSAWRRSVIHEDFFVLLVLSLALFGLGLFFLRKLKGIEDKDSRRFNTILLIAGSVYAYILLWLSLYAGLQNENTAVMISLVVYTIVGLITYFYGSTHKKRTLHLYGGALVGFVVGRLLLVDIWEMELTGRIITFFLIGTLLVSTAFLGKRKVSGPLSNKLNV